MNIEKLISQGYRRTSGKFGVVSRVDREDWKELMAEDHAPWDIEQGRLWVRCLGDSASDHYRRCYSKDTLELGYYLGRKFPSSSGDSTGYINKGDK